MNTRNYLLSLLIPPALGFALHTIGLNLWIFLSLAQDPRKTVQRHVVKASNKPAVAVRRRLSLLHYHSHHGTDDCNYSFSLPLSPSCLSLRFSICFSPVRLSFRSHLHPTLALSPRHLSSVAAINLFTWKCKSVISQFTLTADEMVDIAQIGFSPIPGLLLTPPCLLSHQT